MTSLFAHYSILVNKVRKSKSTTIKIILQSSLSHGIGVRQAVWRMDHWKQQPNFKKQAKRFFNQIMISCWEVCVFIVSVLHTWLHEKVKAQYCVTWRGRLRGIIMVEWAGKKVGVERVTRVYTDFTVHYVWGKDWYYNLSQYGSGALHTLLGFFKGFYLKQAQLIFSASICWAVQVIRGLNLMQSKVISAFFFAQLNLLLLIIIIVKIL